MYVSCRMGAGPAVMRLGPNTRLVPGCNMHMLGWAHHKLYTHAYSGTKACDTSLSSNFDRLAVTSHTIGDLDVGGHESNSQHRQFQGLDAC